MHPDLSDPKQQQPALMQIYYLQNGEPRRMAVSPAIIGYAYEIMRDSKLRYYLQLLDLDRRVIEITHRTFLRFWHLHAKTSGGYCDD